jgi:glycosyltransferase involved in cell wall biosynthesis
MNQLVISVVICTYNRAADLRVVLESLTKQRNAGSYELIVVDNNSTDATATVVAEICTRNPQLRYVFEPQQGLSHARNRGWQEACGIYVAYLDDDCKAPPQWLSIAQTVATQLAPDVFGGPYVAFYNTPKPRWFKDAYGSHVQGMVARALGTGEYLHGGNLVLRRDLLAQLGGFDPAYGMRGHVIAYAEEIVLQQRIRLRPNASIHYEPGLFVYHLVAARKMTWRWNLRDSARYTPAQRGNGRLWLALKAVLLIIMLIGDVIWGLVGRNRQRYPYAQNYMYERALNRIKSLGNLTVRYQQRRAKG